jgi:hypothetical protein
MDSPLAVDRTRLFTRTILIFQIICLCLITVLPSRAMQAASKKDLAKNSQNQVVSMPCLPLQNNTNLGVGSSDDVQNILNIQPVIPLKVSSDWNLITRTIVPVIHQPVIVPGGGSNSDIGYVNIGCKARTATPFLRRPSSCLF